MFGEEMFIATSVILGSQRCGGCRQPWEHLWLLAHPSWCCSSELWLALLQRVEPGSTRDPDPSR